MLTAYFHRITELTDSFETLGLRSELVQAVTELGYETPSPIQLGAIPPLLEGRDILGQAQTGTGKTAAFALPMLNNLDLNSRAIQGLVLAPTRELAMQVSDAISQYGRLLRVGVLPVYGGQSYTRQMSRLQRGVHIVVGTPGRMLDLIRQRALDLSGVKFLVLDEADEMLKMGFIDDVEAILRETPDERQTALFSATLPNEIRRLAQQYMHDPASVTIAHKVLTVAQTEQRYYLVREDTKRAALARLLEVDNVTSALVFARTRLGAAELAEALLARGFAVEALHGDLGQEARESVLRKFRAGHVSVLVATDVAARGLDIDNVSHVFNFDMPYDPEDYVHRIGRTGRAGRDGIAITFVTPRERRWLGAIEAFTRQSITRAKMPSPEDVQARRDVQFQTRLSEILSDADLSAEQTWVEQMAEAGYDLSALAAAAVRLARASETQRPIEHIEEVTDRPQRERFGREGAGREYAGRESGPRPNGRGGDWRSARRGPDSHEEGMVRLTVNVGRAHGLQPGDVVGAIAGAAGIPGRSIGAINIDRDETYVDVREEHVERVLKQTGRIILRGQTATLTRGGGGPRSGGSRDRDNGDRSGGGYRNRGPRRASDRNREPLEA
jgi:ATP-dependent RNA helicase DeaD